MPKSARDIAGMKGKSKISAVTGYDFTMASLCDRAGIDIILVGDSAGMVMLGYSSTTQVTMDQMCMFTQAASNARKDALLVADLPFMSYQTGAEDAIRNSGRLVKAGAGAVKLEGGSKMAGVVRAIVDVGIPVMGHIGVQPQTSMLAGGYRVQGRTAESAAGLLNDARSLEEAGAFSVALEMVASEAAGIISESVRIPTIGIGSGAGCDGQVLVVQDLLGMYDKIKPKFAKRYLSLAEDIVGAISRYKEETQSGIFPAKENSFGMDKEELGRLRDMVGR